jgi:hypothetical protein
MRLETTGKDFSRVKPTLDLSEAVAGNAVCCGIVAHASVQATADRVPALRQTPGPRGEPLPPSFWKHADDQTVVGLSAVFGAISRYGLDPKSFTGWGVIAAPRFLGRAMLGVALNRFLLEGAWGISPHLIPHRSLHSISGTISQALKIHGPNFGVGGGPHAASEAIAVAGGMVADDRLPGVWLVMTGYHPEIPAIDPAGPEAVALASPSPVVGAVALALVRDELGTGRLRLRIIAGAATPAGWPPFSLQALLDALAQGQAAPAKCWRLDSGAVALESAEAAAETSP